MVVVLAEGHDNQAIIFHDIKNYKELMKGELPNIKFKEEKELDGSYKIIKKMNLKISLQKMKIKEDKIFINNRKTGEMNLIN